MDRVEMRRSPVRVQLDSAIIGGDRFVKMPLRGQQITENRVERVAVRIERNRLPQQRLRLPQIPFEHQRLCQAQPARRRVRGAGGGAAVGLRRFLSVTLGLE
jgi:hypothetical protein